MKIIFKPFLLSILFFQKTHVTPANPEEKKKYWYLPIASADRTGLLFDVFQR